MTRHDPESTRFDRLFPWLYAAVFMAAALSVQLAWFPVGDLGTESDFYGDFVLAAQKLAAGKFSVASYPFKGPVYSIALVAVHAPVSLLGGDWYRAGVLLNLLCAGAVIVLLYRHLAPAFGRRTAACSVIGTSLAFEFFLHAHKATSDLLFLLLAYLAIERIAAVGWTARRLTLAGAIAGLAYLTRYNGLIVPVAGLVVVLLVNRDRRRWRARWIGAAALLAGFAATIAPWYAINYVQTGRLLATRNLQNIFVEELHDRDSAAADDRPDSLLGVVAEDPGRVVGRWLANVPDHLRRDLGNSLNGHVTLLLILGALRLLIIPPRRRHLAVLTFPLLYFLAMCAVYYQPRFAFAAWPGWFALGFAVLGGDGTNAAGGPLRGVAERLKRAHGRAPERAELGALILVAGLVFGLQISDLVTVEREYHRRLPGFVLDLAPELRRLAAADPDAVVMARKPHLAYYAGLTYLQYPDELGDASDFLRFAAEHGVRFVVVGPVERGHYPESLYLEELSRYAGVERVYNDDETSIYELSSDLDTAAPAVNEVTADLERRLAEARAAGAPVPIFQLSVLAAEARVRDGDWETAARHLETGLAALPSSDQPEARRAIASARLNLAQTYLKLGRYGDGRDLLAPAMDEIAQVLPAVRRGDAHASLGRLLEHLGEMEEARRELGAAEAAYLSAGETTRAEDMRRHLEKME